MATNVRASTMSARNLSWRACVGLASLLAFGTIAWQHLVHTWIAGPAVPLRSHLSHALRDGALVGTRAVGLLITGTVMGSVLFRLLVAIALRWGLNPNDLKLITAIFVFAALVMPDLARRVRVRAPVPAKAA